MYLSHDKGKSNGVDDILYIFFRPLAVVHLVCLHVEL